MRPQIHRIASVKTWSALLALLFTFSTSLSFKNPNPIVRRAFSQFLSIEDLTSDVQSCRVELQCPDNLKNRYFGLRHGESEANKLGVISSNPAVGTVSHGLTQLGRYAYRVHMRIHIYRPC